jgi:CheY-like chemotaxis protein
LRKEQRFTSVPIVAVTASAMQGDREKATAAGFNGYLTKPLALADLRNEIQRLLVSA